MGDATDAAPVERPRAGRGRRRLLVAFLALLLAVAAAEAGMRFVLFAEPARDTALGRRLRHAELYATSDGDDYWKLDVLFRRPNFTARPHALFDAQLGWLSEAIDPATLAHADEARLAGRRPVLLFGDSFAECVDRAGDCFEELLERSDLADRFALLNYGVGGYGLDQAWLLAQRVVERFQGRDPVVVIAILVDDDLDRCLLRVRGHPKPWFALESGALVAHPPAEASPLALVQQDPPGIRSYLWRALLFGAGLVDRATAERWTGSVAPPVARDALCRRILTDVQSGLDARGLSWFFLLFHGQTHAPAPVDWQEPFLLRVLAGERMPFTSTRRWLRSYADAEGVGFEAFYFAEGRGANHFNALGNRVAFEALRQGLLGDFERPE